MGSTPARVALAWVQGRPGVTSTIIGARTLAQLEDNVKTLDLALSKEHVAALDALTKPTLGFPMGFIANAGVFINGGTTVNGESAPLWPMAPKNDEERY